jgi:di/tricarboxylate transporter
MPFAVVIAIAASAGFATPLGYQTHLMVYGAGGYRFSDYRAARTASRCR